MSIETVRAVLLWSTFISYGLLLWWFLLFAVAHEWLHRFTAGWFRLSAEQFDAINYAGTPLDSHGDSFDRDKPELSHPDLKVWTGLTSETSRRLPTPSKNAVGRL